MITTPARRKTPAQAQESAADAAIDPEARQLLYRRAVQTFDQVRQFRDRLQADLAARRFGADDIRMREYNDLLATSLAWFSKDAILTQLPSMPDETLRGMTLVGQLAGPGFVTQRVLGNTQRLLNRLETIFGTATPAGSEAAAEQSRSARDVLRAEADHDARGIIEAIESLRQQQPAPPPIDARGFDFVLSTAHRQVLTADYIEAQRAFYSEAYKASALLSGGIIEGMLMDAMQGPEVQQHPDYGKAVDRFPKQPDASIIWDRVSMTQLIAATRELGLLDAGALRMAQGARDFRDTVHPNAEVRQVLRAGREDAELLLVLVRLVYRDLTK